MAGSCRQQVGHGIGRFADATDSAPRGLIHRAYNVVTWSKEGILYWAISDLNMAEMRLLQSLLEAMECCLCSGSQT